jgi:membrane-associated phospholipid phosphatase
VILVNGVMLAAKPLNGGHYFIDLIAGVTIAVAAIVAARLVARIIARRQIGLALIPPIPVAAREEFGPASAAR